MRLKISHAKGDLEFLECIKQSISPMPGVRQVDVNPRTGSVLIEYDPAAHGNFHERLERHAAEAAIFDLRPPELSEVDELAMKIEREAEF
ncbi:MAG: heavy-metal-associated domain-containing protein, partial [Acidobacteriota bacterium]|nr:heavy-metal-associated domain-containing protein [Acidobacteriota bacterium]